MSLDLYRERPSHPLLSARDQSVESETASAARRDKWKLERSSIADLAFLQRFAAPFGNGFAQSRRFGNGRGWGVELQTPDSSQLRIVWSFGPRRSASLGMSFRDLACLLFMCPFSAACCKDIGLSSDSLSVEHVAGGVGGLFLRTDPCCSPGQAGPRGAQSSPGGERGMSLDIARALLF